MSVTITGKNQATQLTRPALRVRSCSDSEQATQERRLWKAAAEAASSTFSTFQLFLAVLFLAVALVSVAIAFAELTHLLERDAIRHVTEKAIDESNQNRDSSGLPPQSGNPPRSSVTCSWSEANSVLARSQLQAAAEEFVDHVQVRRRTAGEFHESGQKDANRRHTTQGRTTDIDLAKSSVSKQKLGAPSPTVFLVRQ